MANRKTKEVYEIEGSGGVFTYGVDDKYEAHDMFLDWYYEHHKDKESRWYFEEYVGIGLKHLDMENIHEETMMRCNGCGKWWIDDTECHDCEGVSAYGLKKLDGRTKCKTFVVFFP